MKHARAQFLGVLTVIAGLVLLVVYDVSADLFWGGVVLAFLAWLFVEFYRAYVYGRVADRQWQRANPKPVKPTKVERGEGLRVVRGSDQPGKRVMI